MKARSSAVVFRALHELAVVTTGRTSPDEVAQAAARTATLLLGDSATLRWWDAETGALTILHDTSVDGATPARPPAGGAAARAFATREPVVVADAAKIDPPAGYPAHGARSVAAVPLLVGDRALGTLAVRSLRPRAYNAGSVRLLELIAAQAAPALVAAQHAAERERANRTLVFLHELAVASGGIADPAELAQLASRRAADLLGCEAGGLAWAEGDGELFRAADTEFGVTPAKPGRGVLWRAYREGRPVATEDYPGEIGVPAVDVEIASALAVPLLIGDRAVGALGVRSPSGRHFGPEHEQTLQLLAAQVAPALERARVHRELERRTAAMIALDDIALAVGSDLDEARLVELAVERVKKLLDVEGVALTWFDADQDQLRMVTSFAEPEWLDRGEGATGLAFETGRPVVVNNERPSEEEVDGAVAVVPLRVGERMVGTLGVSAAPPRTFYDEDVQVLSLVAAQLAPALEAARLHGDLEAAVEATARRARQQEAVAKLGWLALSGVSVDEMMTGAAHAVRDAIDADFIGIHEVDGDGAGFVIRHLSGRSGEIPLAERHVTFEDWPMSARALRDGAVLIQDLGTEAGFVKSPLLPRGALSAMTVRIGPRDKESFGVIGAVSVKRNRYQESDLGFLHSIANVLAEAIARRQAEQELRRSRQELQTVLDHAGVVLFALDARGRFRMVEGALLDRIGVRAERVMGRPLTRFLADNPRAIRAVRQALQGRFADYDHLVNGRDLDVVLHPVATPEGSISGIIGVAIDVTERRLVAVAQQESEAKSRFLAAMSHELRTPLNAVLGFAQLLAIDPNATLSERQSRYLDNIEQSGRHLLSLINDLLDLSRVAAGQMPIQVEPVRADEAILSVVSRARPLIDDKQLTVIVEVPGEHIVRADPRRLEQVVWNLLSNAVKFTDPGGQIEIGATSRGEMIELSVADNGIGIPEDLQQRIFDEFTQVESTLTRNHQGTGLGLALSRRLVELMGGTIEVTSQLGRGSRFVVCLPADEAIVSAAIL